MNLLSEFCLTARIPPRKALSTHRCGCVSALLNWGCRPACKQGRDLCAQIVVTDPGKLPLSCLGTPVPPGEVSASDHCLSGKLITFKCLSRSFDMYKPLMVLQVFT